MTVEWRTIAAAGHTGDEATARAAFADADATARELALGALHRMGRLQPADLAHAMADPSPAVRRRAAIIAATDATVDIMALLADPDPTVVEAAAWAAGEHASLVDAVPSHVVARLVELGTTAPEPLVREAAVAALGAIGDPLGLPAILAGCTDKPTVRRRAVLALAPFDTPEVHAALAAALTDRDWQVRQAAEDIAPR